MTKNWFYARNQSWWLIGFSIVMSSGILAESQLISDRLLNGDLSEMWLFWSVGFGTSLGIVFFAHLWKNVPVKTENEFIFFRFSGSGALYLHRFRSFYLGFLVIPLIMSFHLLSIAKMISLLFSISIAYAIIAIAFCLFLFTFLNGFVNRLRFDFIYFIIFIVLFLFVLVSLTHALGGMSKILNVIQTTAHHYSLIPKVDSPLFVQFLVIICVQWWSALIVDYPDQNGQKLMASQSATAATKSMLVPIIFQLLMKWILFMLPFIVVGFGLAKQGADGEVAFIALFCDMLPSWMLVIVFLLFFLPVLSILQNDQNWGGGILIENFFKGILKPDSFEQKRGFLSIAAMIYLVIAASLFAAYADSISLIVKYMLSITAGVGPVFMLRWYWWRINAWSQLSAMVAALLYPILFDLLYANSTLFHGFIDQLCITIRLEVYGFQLLLYTLLVALTWISITFLTSPTDADKLQQFAQTIRPGGFWGKYQDNATCYPRLRFLAWLLLACNSFLMYVIFWKFITGFYTITILLLIVYVLFFWVAYRIIKRLNKKQDLFFGIEE